ncbi:sensor histidine kinase [Xylanibacter oryzae]|uniref:sensor histidine kinase n=1 Tax=Xylanibacter oryzae TaxID=185293 RepID=UPI00146FB324|nr:HAMP domain-containing sensor histidine kinase [Xylanibacter oryzae]
MRIKEKSLEMEHAGGIKNAFLHNMSHEIRTPLNSIVGFMQLLDTDVTAEEHDLFVGIIHQNTELLVHMIDNMLLMASLECGEYPISPIEFDISSLMHDLAEALHGYIHAGVELKVKVHKPQYVRLDLNSLRRVLKALILNANKFTPKGSITVDYNVDGDMFNVSVADTGIGIAVEDRKRIFGKFEKLDHFSQGLGLGLPICKAIVKKLGGRIGVQSKLGCGSTFRFSVPYCDRRE